MTIEYRHIDPAVLFNAAGEDQHGFNELLAMFLRIVPPMLRELDDAVRAGRMADIAHHAHSLKSCLSLVGALGCGARLEQLEREARSNASDCGASFEALHDDITCVIAEALDCHAASARLP